MHPKKNKSSGNLVLKFQTEYLLALVLNCKVLDKIFKTLVSLYCINLISSYMCIRTVALYSEIEMDNRLFFLCGVL